MQSEPTTPPPGLSITASRRASATTGKHSIWLCYVFWTVEKIAAAELIRALNHLADKVEHEQRKGSISEDYYAFIKI